MSRKKKKQDKVICPYCGRTAALREGSFLFGKRATIPYLYVCSGYPECDSYVAAHEHNLMPQGTLANKELREKRIAAHSHFDRIHRLGIMTRKQSYQWLKFALNLPSEQAHIGFLSAQSCDQVIQKSIWLLDQYGAAVR